MKTYLKPLKRDQRKNFTQKKVQKFKSGAEKTLSIMKEILGNQLFELKLLPTKLTFLMPKKNS